MHGRRYPRFEVYTEQVIIATSLEKAKEGMRKHIEKGRRLDNIYAFYIREIPVGEDWEDQVGVCQEDGHPETERESFVQIKEHRNHL